MCLTTGAWRFRGVYSKFVARGGFIGSSSNIVVRCRASIARCLLKSMSKYEKKQVVKTISGGAPGAKRSVITAVSIRSLGTDRNSSQLKLSK